MTIEWLLGWWNLIFVAPFAVALLYLGVYTLTGLGDGDAHDAGGGDSDADADADAHVGVDGDAGADADADAHADAHNGETSGSGSLHALALSWLGVGRVPVALIVIVLLLTWGGAGFVTNAALRPAGSWEAARVSVPVALCLSLFVTRAIVLFIGRYVPLNETYARGRDQLVGCVGEAVFAIDERFGMAAVRDGRGDLHQVTCRVASGVEPVGKGAKVRLVAYGREDQTFFVRRVSEDQT
jgi:membrane protein implicated in regulation of membrane protease activity